MDITAKDLYRKLKEIEDRIRRNEQPDRTCSFEPDKVYVLLEAALGFIPAPGRETQG